MTASSPPTWTASAARPGKPPERIALPLRRAQALRYGENPHQKAALYGRFFDSFQQLHGKELSYNNLLDISAAAELIGDFAGAAPTVAILKHTNPCGVGSAATLAEAWELAYATDRQAPFGGIIAVNRPLDLPAAQAIAEIFSEVVVAPDFLPEARALLEKKKTSASSSTGGGKPPAPSASAPSSGTPSWFRTQTRARRKKAPSRSSRSAPPRRRNGKPSASAGKSSAT